MLNKLNIKFFLSPLLVFMLLSLILIFSWFRYGYMYGGGDVGLPSYDPQRIFEISKYLWWEASAPGTLIPNSTISAPLAFGLSILQVIGFSDVLIQATLFYILLVLMGYGMFLLSSSVFGDDKKYLPYLAALFYMFNPYMMIQVWHRFVHTTFFLAAALPFLVLFWRQWINTGKSKHLLFFLLVNFLAVYMFGTIAFVLTLWLLILLITAVEITIPWRGLKVFWKGIILFGIGFILWVMINSWWLISTFSIGPGIYSQQHTNDESLSTLLVISQQAIIPYSIQLINPFYMFEQAEFGQIYGNTFFKSIPWIFVGIILLGLIKSFLNKKFIIFGILYLVILFLTKGASEPFSYPYIIGFKKIFFLGAFRNPFEKIGVLLPLPSSILFVLGFSSISNYLSKKTQLIKFLMLFGVIGLILIYCWPMLQGKIFGRIDKPAFIKVPTSYADADQLIKKSSKEGNILHLPLTRNEGIPYKWDYGYVGVEPNQLLFTSLPSISKGFNLSRLDDALTGLSLIFENPSSNHPLQMLSLLQNFNVKFIILHRDIVWRGSDTYDPQKTEVILNNLNFLQKKAEYPELVVFELLPQYYKPKLVLTENPTIVYPQNSTIRYWPWKVASSSGELLTPINKPDLNLFQKAQTILIFSDKINIEKIGSDQEILMNHFEIPQDGQYELLLTKPEIRNIYPNGLSNLTIQVDNQLKNIQGKDIDGFISYGKLDLNYGEHQLNLPDYLSFNIVPDLDKISKTDNVKTTSNDTIELNSNGQQVSYIEVATSDLTGDDIYQVSFDANFLSGIEFFVQVIQDSDSIENNKFRPRNSTRIYRSQVSGAGFQKVDLRLPPLSSTTHEAKIRILVDPLGNTSFNSPSVYALPTLLQIKNLKISRVLNNTLILKKVLSQDQNILPAEDVEFNRISPVLYKGQVRIEKTSYLVFKETYHPDWELTLVKNNKTYKEASHYLANLYANAWKIDEPGEYKFKIEFKSQRKFIYGLYIAVLGWFIILSMVTIPVVKRRMKK